MSTTHGRKFLRLIGNLVLPVVVSSLTQLPGSNPSPLATKTASNVHVADRAGIQHASLYRSPVLNALSRSSSPSAGEEAARNRQKFIPASSSADFAATPGNTKRDTIAERPSFPSASNSSVWHRGRGTARGSSPPALKSQNIVAISGVPHYYPVAVNLRRVYAVPYPWVYYVQPSSRSPPAAPTPTVVNVPVVVHVQPHVIPVQVPTFVAVGVGGFAPDDGSAGGGAGGGEGGPDSGNEAGFVPTYGCGAAKPSNCRGPVRA